MAATYIKNHTNTFTIRGHDYQVNAPARFDTQTNHLVADAELDDAAIELANQQYRSEFHFISPNDLKDFRTKVGLTQRDLAELLDWSPNTVALYETGAFPTRANNKVLKALMADDHVLTVFANEDGETLSVGLHQKICAYLTGSPIPIEYSPTPQPPKFTALQLANWYRVQNYFDAQRDPNVEELSQMKVLKLLYFAFGRHLALSHSPLFNSPIIAMPYGPVVLEVHQKFNGQRGIVDNQLDDNAFTDYSLVQADPEIAQLLISIQNDYGNQTAASLSRITHQKGSPWSVTSAEKPIAPDLIGTTFSQHKEC
ncbi:phage-related infection protein [Levilactobacillus koreensis JCM 16448]|uniref:Toxin-antitoxin system, antitoxin component, Xre domain protein n=1 Tax=Levilactobacillus koreensis TaxID=637971 RepID=A0AAC8UVQ5_9LACO|nr:type II toxin-antitoxin system antitoxin SocA domain-containing protein [Levilactobacillus koreensis]AKP64279.1 toxin-antitoxin system, antitoxin component, Xre domain protein [Levilactobacillus koreensis]KRK87307.1 phage-related infection protein [Levilactobacillus koreensis JCM 16448]